MADQTNEPNRFSTAEEREQSRLIAAHNQEEERRTQQAAELRDKFGEKFQQSASIEILYAGDERTAELASQNIAAALAKEKVSDPNLMDGEKYQRIVTTAVGAALKTEFQQWLKGDEPAAPSLEPIQGAPEQGHEELSQGGGAASETKIGSYADLTREHSEIVARLEAGEDLDAGEKKLSFFEDRQAENAPTIGDERDRSDGSEPGEKRLRFYDELKQEHANATGKEANRSDGTEHEQGDAGEKKLHFFEDRHPSKGHDFEH